MKFGLRYCNTGKYVEANAAVELMQAGEEAGFESAWTVDHVVVPEGYQSAYPYSADGKMASGANDLPLPDLLIWLAYVAARTSRIKLATGILILPQRNPVVTAKQIATLDQMSGGRMLLGIGVGWLEEEFKTLNADFANRGATTDEYIQVLRELWQAEKPTFHGASVNFDAAHCQPQPVNGSVPIIVGGHSKAAARRAGKFGDGFFPARGAPEDLFTLARQIAAENGRDPEALKFTISMPEDMDDLPRLAALGVERVLVPVSGMAGLPATIRNPGDALKWRETIAQYQTI